MQEWTRRRKAKSRPSPFRAPSTARIRLSPIRSTTAPSQSVPCRPLANSATSLTLFHHSSSTPAAQLSLAPSPVIGPTTRSGTTQISQIGGSFFSSPASPSPSVSGPRPRSGPNNFSSRSSSPVPLLRSTTLPKYTSSTNRSSRGCRHFFFFSLSPLSTLPC